ncbi:MULTISPECIES: NAD(P)/FAD-dependent oxidoreductase [unclassified Mesorhizobium]|uniref:NAD(P)/FAD-dependent oxidoreductase n=1 Tax=unclassified Mesorhizobium TaxID=325217 RepID=UPI001CCA9C21|nr:MULTISPECIES: FAD-dependent oxidoreductase [unclassified Mesorhizobium]MBZ9734536.1 FAD-binding oxidoreductase [Mesorhizobium sp. CA9]MBZ9812139.1 FAD-binding oxidoreductase [Mesorhizobium sp. CA7]MBZ9826928.1 FAD-binding oxidoreductase [Mesorhizobium sp. CA18]MBZ9832450.1 FAD-binding oxidoreductase [Mesorhizobium sp. CA2]MBZ9838494.1 FAD-binding oxidoreductase [Mesorhizobium sp. CA3]
MARHEALSLWHAVGRHHCLRPALEDHLDVDLAVVGGGFAGLSTALHGASKGLSVAVLEAEIIAWGATGRNAGFIVPNFAKMDPDAILAHLGAERGERLIGVAAGSADLVFNLIARHSIACDAVQNGWIQAAHSSAALERIQSRARQWAERGRPAVILDSHQTEALTGARGYAGGWMDRSGGVLNPVHFARGLADAAENAGARIFEHSRVTSIDRLSDGWTLTTPSGSLRAGKVLIATNAYGGALNPTLQRTYFPLKVFQIATAPLPSKARQRLLPGDQGFSDTRRNLLTFRFDAQNRLISGGMHVVSAGADRRVPRTIWRRLARRLELPDLPPLEYSWSGIAAVEPDFLPHLIDLGPGLMAARACNGRGIAMTTAMGRVLAEWAAGTEGRDLPLPFAPPAPIPLHGLLRYAPNMLLPWSMLRDRFDRPG